MGGVWKSFNQAEIEQHCRAIVQAALDAATAGLRGVSSEITFEEGMASGFIIGSHRLLLIKAGLRSRTTFSFRFHGHDKAFEGPADTCCSMSAAFASSSQVSLAISEIIGSQAPQRSFDLSNKIGETADTIRAIASLLDKDHPAVPSLHAAIANLNTACSLGG